MSLKHINAFSFSIATRCCELQCTENHNSACFRSLRKSNFSDSLANKHIFNQCFLKCLQKQERVETPGGREEQQRLALSRCENDSILSRRVSHIGERATRTESAWPSSSPSRGTPAMGAKHANIDRLRSAPFHVTEMFLFWSRSPCRLI